mmetsp:Transcript_26493/g.74209  ORF Transcript_26493/g.74209 Transcript_26493/m.74209 type:complete len:101 (+) Transcript_26493:561-863(+)|eukprot:scaffold185184_cov29-Tisochrysis_lutea.AAC.9
MPALVNLPPTERHPMSARVTRQRLPRLVSQAMVNEDAPGRRWIQVPAARPHPRHDVCAQNSPSLIPEVESSGVLRGPRSECLVPGGQLILGGAPADLVGR